MRRFFLQLPGSVPVEIDPEDLWEARGDMRAFAADIAYHLSRQSPRYNGESVKVFDEAGQMAAFVPIMPFEYEMISQRAPSPVCATMH